MKSFTLIEFIFVIIIVGVLSISAINSLPDNTLIDNTNYIYNKILEKKANALGFMANMENEDENNSVCIVFDKNWLKDDEKRRKVKFNLSSRVEIKSEYKTICFDYLGRPYKGRVDLLKFSNLLHKKTDINITYNDKYKTIEVYPITGDIEIK